jgi:DNA modification methylase
MYFQWAYHKMAQENEQLALFENHTPISESSETEVENQTNTKLRANGLDGKTWTKHSISIWSDLRKTSEEIQLKHPAMFPLALASRSIACFMNSQDHRVIDPFSGVGTTVLAAREAGKLGIGIEISPEFAEIARSRLAQSPLMVETSGGDGVIHTDNALNLLNYVQPETIDFCLTSPPYWDILLQQRTADYKEQRDYGNTVGDLGKIQDYQAFIKALADVMHHVFLALRPGKYCLMVVMDIRKKARFYPFHSDLANAMQEIGFIYDDLIIWDRRHEYNNMRPLGYPHKFRINKAHEYILIFQKPE